MASYEVLRYLLISVFAFALFLGSYALASAPTRIASRLGMRGLKRRRAIETNPLWSHMEPLVRWLGMRLSGIIPPKVRIKLDTRLQLAGDFLGLEPEESVALAIVSFLLGIVAGTLFGWLAGNVALITLMGGTLGITIPSILITNEAQRRFKQIGRGLPYVIDLMALAMSAGLDFPGAIRQVVEKSSDPEDALIEELNRIQHELQLGRTRRQALLDLGRRVPSDQVVEFVNALIQAEDRGNPVADVLMIQAGVARTTRSVRAEEAAAKAGVAMLIPLLLLFLCIMILVMAPIVFKLANSGVAT